MRIDAAKRQEISRITLPQVKHERIEPGFGPSELTVPEYLVVAGDRLYASTVDHGYVIDVATPGAEHATAAAARRRPNASSIAQMASGRRYSDAR